MTMLEIKTLLYMAECFYSELKQTFCVCESSSVRNTMLRVVARDAEDLALLLRKYVEQEKQSGKDGE